MLRRNTIIVLGVFVVALLLAIIVQQNVEAPGDATSTPSPSYAFVDEDASIVRLSIKSEEGEELLLEKISEVSWEVSGIQEGDPDIERITSIVSQLKNFQIVTDLENPPQLREIGLEPPRFVLTAVLDNDIRKIMYVGDLTPTRSGYYVQFDETDPMVVSRPGLERAIELIDDPPLAPTPTVTTQPTDT